MEKLRYKMKMALFTGYYYSIELILHVRSISSDRKQFLLKIIPWLPIILIRWIFSGLYEKTFGKILAKKLRKTDEKHNFIYDLGVVAIAKNEGNYILEWIKFYKAIGADVIYLYDNDSDDNTYAVIEEYINNGFVKWIPFSGKMMQIPAYNDAIEKYRNECRYMAFVDLDEFIIPAKEEPVLETINRIMSRNLYAGGIGVNWVLFGSSGYKTKQNKPVTQTFFYRADNSAWPNFHVKTICNPRAVKNYISPHFPIYKLGFINIAPNGTRQYVWGNRYVDYSEIRCHHYFCKSAEEWIIKRSRGMADRNQSYNMEKFNEYDLNDVFDDIMLRYSDYL